MALCIVESAPEYATTVERRGSADLVLQSPVADSDESQPQLRATASVQQPE